MRIAFFGLPLAAWLLHRDGHEIAFAVLSPVPAPGARRLRHAIGADNVVDADDKAEIDRRIAGAELLVSWYWTRRLPPEWLSAPRHGAIGAHPSLLPRFRGPDPFFAAIDAGDALTGVTVHRLDAGYDTGPILLAQSVSIGDRDTWQLARALDRPSLSLLRDAARRIAAGDPMPGVAQDESLASWAGEPEGDSLRVDWRWPSARILRRIRALSPSPGLAIELLGEKLFVTRARSTTRLPEVLAPGEAAVDAALGVAIRSGDAGILVEAAVVGEDSGYPAGTGLDATGVAALVAGKRDG